MTERHRKPLYFYRPSLIVRLRDWFHTWWQR